MEEFLVDFNNEIYLQSASNGETTQDTFFEIISELLIDDGVCKEAQIVNDWNNDKTGIQIDGYGGDPFNDENVLTLFLTTFSASNEIVGINMAELTSLIKRGANYINKIRNNEFVSSLEKTSSMFLVSQFLSRRIIDVEKFRFIVITNKLLKVRSEQIETPIINDKNSEADIWDLDRIKRLYEGKNTQEDIVIDLKNDLKDCIPVLRADLSSVNYLSYLAVISGDLLARIYEQWGNRLLERNVRVFLQARGKVNKDIRDTIENRPQMFFAFNNGITATADEVKLETLYNARVITEIKNLQIVNGGQTTSSIYAAYKKDGVSLKEVFVQMKLSEIKEKSMADEIVPEISRCANSQNKVKSPDFSSTHPFHRQIEKLSRRIYAPTTNNQIKPSKWFYERTRGQYLDNKSKFKGAEKKRFENEYPKDQYFLKTDLARYINSWDQIPTIVSKGPEKNFTYFTGLIEKNWEKNSDKYNDFYFKNLIGKAILWNKIKKLASKKNGILNYGTNVTIYAISKISYDIPQRLEFDFIKVWNSQSIRPDFENCLLDLVQFLYKIITNPPPDQNSIPSEFAKAQRCWEIIKESKFPWNKSIEYYLISKEALKKEESSSKKVKKLTNDLELEILVAKTTGTFWRSLDDWIFANSSMIKITGTEAKLLKDSRGIPKTFFPNTFECKRLINLYQRAKEIGFPGEFNFN